MAKIDWNQLYFNTTIFLKSLLTRSRPHSTLGELTFELKYGDKCENYTFSGAGSDLTPIVQIAIETCGIKNACIFLQEILYDKHNSSFWAECMKSAFGYPEKKYWS